jgi:large subunit ribosomal protein L29
MSQNAQTLEKLRDQPSDELQQALARTRDELFRLHLGQHTNQVTSSAQLQTKRREIAQIMTILRGRQLGLEVQAQKQAAKAEAVEAEATTEPKTKKTAKKKDAKS